MAVTSPYTGVFSVKPSAVTDVFAFYKSLRRSQRWTALLESLGDLDPDTSRYSIVGVVPGEAVVVTNASAVHVDFADGRERPVADWVGVLDGWTTLSGPEPGTAPTPVQTGVIGYVGYDVKGDFERYENLIGRDTAVPDALLVRYDVVLVHDRLEQSTWWAAAQGFEDRCDELERLVEPPAEGTNAEANFALLGELSADFERDQYLASIARTIEYIRRGDIFQANITARFSGRVTGDPIQLYERLRQVTANPFFAFLDFACPIISTSPERFFCIRGDRIATYPIKGTVRCEIDGVDQRDDLARSEKNLAENTMITDLMRNDIGRVCEQGSVEVLALCTVKRFTNLYHLESEVQGTLKPGRHVSDVLRAVIPGGSISGAPKIRAVEIIEELENRRRGPYCGAIGFFGSAGWVDTSIAIRILYIDEDRIFFHAGGGIVADSTPEGEYEELMLKVERIRACLESFHVLRSLREELDMVDDQLFHLLASRFRLVREVAAVKSRYSIPSLQRQRWASIVARQEERYEREGALPRGCVQDVYDVVVRHAMDMERSATPAAQTGSPG